MSDSGKQVGFGDVGCFRPGDMMKVWEYLFEFEVVAALGLFLPRRVALLRRSSHGPCIRVWVRVYDTVDGINPALPIIRYIP